MKRSIIVAALAALLTASAAFTQSMAADEGYRPYSGHMHMHPGYGHGYGHHRGPGPGWGHMMPHDEAMPGYGRRRGGPMYGRGRFAMVDINEDGGISAEEAAAAAEGVFIAMDAEEDGALTPDEYMSVRMGPGRGRNAARRQRRQDAKEARFAEMDADSDGSVTKPEFMAMAEQRHTSADTDGDGKITPWEHRARN